MKPILTKEKSITNSYLINPRYQTSWLHLAIFIAILFSLPACRDGSKVLNMEVTNYFNDPQTIELAKAAARGDVSEIGQLAGAGVDINSIGNEGMTPAMWALAAKSKDGLRTLLKLGADPNYLAPNGATLATLAAGAKDSELLKIILAAGANPDQKNNRGDAPLHVAIRNLRWENFNSLLNHGADLDITDSFGNTPILLAATLNQFEQVAYLIEKGADFQKPNQAGATVAKRVEKNEVHPETSHYKWQQKVKEMLKSKAY